MLIECPSCGKQGNIDASRVPEKGAKLKCQKCGESFFVAKENSPAQAPPQPQAPAQSQVQPRQTPQPQQAIVDQQPQQPCKMCRQSYQQRDMVQISGAWICSGCKPTYVQMLQQGESTASDMRYAGFWIRVAAKIIDSFAVMIILFPIITALTAMMAFDPQSHDPNSSMIIFMALQYFVQIGIPAALTTFFLGKFRATPGKMALGLIVVTPERAKISYLRALGRHFGEWLSSMILGIGYVMVAFDDEKRSLHDRICGTRVVYK
ncbi:MAG: zinc-ribbon domain-containing protein [Desulfuromonadales bacterium]|nr:zinc-ribbon domain-containing protein [Desulfuromonadales bacterium]